MTKIGFHLRDADLDDVDDLTQIAIAVIPQEPAFQYLYPKADQYPEDVYRNTRIEIKQFIENSIADWEYRTMVCQRAGEGGQIIAFSVWEVSVLQGQKAVQQTAVPSGCNIEEKAGKRQTAL